MILTDIEYERLLAKKSVSLDQLEEQRQQLVVMNLSQDEIKKCMEPLECFFLKQHDEIAYYEKLKSGFIPELTSLQNFGRWLVEIRISFGLSQTELAKRLGLLLGKIIRDEINEYHGISLDKAMMICEVIMGPNHSLRIHIEKEK